MKYNINATGAGSSDQESPAQVRAAIRELFPKIPDDDLEGIADYAWQNGTDRVGNAADLDLSRRVQLAVIARIRHKYTDYDRLLRAFEWREARTMTEPVCLVKLIEWRGEHEDNEDGELEEVVRETIVIDDDDDVAANGSEADDEDSIIEIEDNSDASIEVTHHLADDTDIGAESMVEKPRHLPYRQRQAPRRSKRIDNLNKNIAAARRQVQNRDVPPPAHQQQTYNRPPVNSGPTVPIQGPPTPQSFAPPTVVKDGVTYRLVSVCLSTYLGFVYLPATDTRARACQSRTPVATAESACTTASSCTCIDAELRLRLTSFDSLTCCAYIRSSSTVDRIRFT